MSRFHPLLVRDVRRETPDTVSIALDVPGELRDAFARIVAACQAAGKRVGIHAMTARYASQMARSGFDLVTVWVDAAAIAATLGTVAEVWAEQAPGATR